MAAKERGEVTQRAIVLLISFLRFLSLSNERREAQELRRFVIFIAMLTF